MRDASDPETSQLSVHAHTHPSRFMNAMRGVRVSGCELPQLHDVLQVLTVVYMALQLGST